MTNPFWTFSLAFYDDAQTQRACLEFQDRLGGDVNLLLYHLYLADRGLLLERDDSARIDAAVATWRVGVVEPLRALRRRLKVEALGPVPIAQEGFRSKLKAVELHAERVLQEMLSTLPEPARRVPSRDDAAGRNLAALAAFLGADPQDPVFTTLLCRFGALGR